MRHSALLLLFLAASIVVAACNLDRGVSETGTIAPGSRLPSSSDSEAVAPEATTPGPRVKLPEVNLPEVDVPAGAVATAQAALQQAGDTAGTAARQAGTAVQQAEDAAGTAAVVVTEQGGAALATVQAINTPDLTQLTERLAAVRPDENGNLSVTLNESELNQLLRLRYLVMSAEPELSDATVRFESGLIVLSGNVPLLLPVGVTLSLRPVVSDGQFELEILDASVGRLQAPEIVLGFASDLVSSTLDEIIRRLPEGFQLQSITVDEGLLTISGRINN